MIPKKIGVNDYKNQQAIDNAYSESKEECDFRLNDAKKFITCIRPLHVFEAGFNRLIHEKKSTYTQDRVCWCPCNKHFHRWRELYQCQYDDGDYRVICENKKFTPQELIAHLGSHRIEQCHYHRLLYLYIKTLYSLYRDTVFQVSGCFELKYQNTYYFKFMNR